MFLIAGLGNPDKKYEKTRHNIGFDTVDALAEKYNISITEKKHKALCGSGVIEGEKGLFIAMPSRKAGDGDFRDIAHPINSATRDQIQGLILKKYEEVLQEKE